MTIWRILAAALALTAGIAVTAGPAVAGESHCPHSAADYAQAIRHFEGEAARARALAQRNPLYESDLAYYDSVLADARACHRNVSPVSTASR